MNFKKTIFALAIGSVGIMGAMSAQAAALNNGDKLSITAGVGTYSASGSLTGASSGSFFKMVGVGIGLISQGTTGLVIGSTSTPGQIDAPWTFGGHPGMDYVTVPVTGSTTAGVNMSGWTVTWNGIAAIPMGGLAWGTGYTNGVGNLTWDGVYGDAYTLLYHGTVPAGDPSNFGGIQYALTLKGTVTAGQVTSPVPEPETYGMMVAGLGLLGFMVSRRKTV